MSTASKIAALAAGASVATSAQEDYPAWDADTVYTSGDTVAHDGSVWEAQWWTRGDEPGSSEWGPWEHVEDVDDGDEDDGDDDGSDDDTGDYPAWDAGTVYTSGDTVAHDGSVWEAQWWTQGDEPGASQWGPWAEVDDTDDGDDDGDGDDEPEPEPPVAAVDASDTSVDPGTTVEFDASASSDPDGTVESYEWEFGDGSTDAGEMVSHTFEESGSYTVTVTVTDDDGQSDTASTTVTVAAADPPDGPTEELPHNVFAPYHHMNTVPEKPPVEWVDEAGTRYFHLAFILGLSDGTPAWDADHDYVVGESEFGDQIRELQEQGGQVVLSFGGANGPYLASYYSDPAALADTYEMVVDEYDCPYIDIDDEAASAGTNETRNEALSILQDRRPEVEVSYTVRCNSQGMTPSDADVIVGDAIDKGVDIHRVNLMTMNYGSTDAFDGQSVISTVEGGHDQLSERLPEKSEDEIYNMIGICPMLGENDTGVIFRPSDAETVLEYAQNNGIGSLTFWSVERDNPGPGGAEPRHSGIDQEPFEFSNIFNEYNP